LIWIAVQKSAENASTPEVYVVQITRPQSTQGSFSVHPAIGMFCR